MGGRAGCAVDLLWATEAGLRALQLQDVRSAVQECCAGGETTGEFAARSRDGQAQQ
jgi:hypothetical protein